MLCIPQQNPLKYGFSGIEHRLYISLFIEFYNKQAHTQSELLNYICMLTI